MRSPGGPAVSVVIPAYKAARTIARAVDSLMAQSRPPEEVVVVDDGSPDDLAAALAPYGDRVTLVRKANGGAASARNLGIDLCRGEVVGFLDADDHWEPDKLARQLEIMRRHPEVGLVAGRYFAQPPGGERQGPFPEDGPYLDRVLSARGEEAFAIATRIWTTTVLVRRDVLGAHRFVPGLEPAEDRDLWVRLVLEAPAYVESRPSATWVLEPGSLSRSSVDVDCGNMLRVVRRNRGLLGRGGTRRWEADTYRRWAAGHLAQGRPSAALRPAVARLLRQPFSAQGWWVLGKSATMATFSPRRALPRPTGS